MSKLLGRLNNEEVVTIKGLFVSSVLTLLTTYYASKCLFIVLLQFDDGQTEYDGEVQIDAVKKFIQTESLPLVVEFNHDTAQKIFGGDIKSHLLMFLSQSASNYEELLKSAKSVAGPFRDRVSTIWAVNPAMQLILILNSRTCFVRFFLIIIIKPSYRLDLKYPEPH